MIQSDRLNEPVEFMVPHECHALIVYNFQSIKNDYKNKSIVNLYINFLTEGSSLHGNDDDLS